MYTADQPQDTSNEKADSRSSSTAIASFLQDIYSSASRDITNAASSLAKVFMLPALEIGGDTTGDSDKPGDNDLTKTEVSNDVDDANPIIPIQTESGANTVDSPLSKVEIENDKDDAGTTSDTSAKEANSKESSSKDNGGLDKGAMEFKKDLLPGQADEVEAKLNELKSSKQKPFTKQDLLKEFEKAGGTNTLGQRTEEPSRGGKDKSSDEGAPKGKQIEVPKTLPPKQDGSSNSQPEK